MFLSPLKSVLKIQKPSYGKKKKHFFFRFSAAVLENTQ